MVMLVRAKHSVHMVHYLMALLVALKSLTVLSQAGMYHMIGVYGHPEGWNIAFVSFTSLATVRITNVASLEGLAIPLEHPLCISQVTYLTNFA